MTDVPYGREGSPLQNLLIRGHRDTMLTALRMTEEIDAGPVYLKRRLSLEGRAQDIFERAADAVFQMIGELVDREPTPKPQQGEIIVFRRRQPSESELPAHGELKAVYDHIRMLDAETYPHAYLDWGDFRISFRKAAFAKGELRTEAIIEKKSKLSS